MPVLEHSVDEFIERFRAHACNVVLYPQPVLSGLLEVRLGAVVVYVLDRTGPFVAQPGPARVILNPVCETVVRSDAQQARLEVVGVSRVAGVGEILEVSPGSVVLRLVVDWLGAGGEVLLVLGVLDDSWRGLQVGEWLGFTSVDAVHGFYLGKIKN